MTDQWDPDDDRNRPKLVAWIERIRAEKAAETITKINDDSASHAVDGSPATPATGTVTSKSAVIKEDTDASDDFGASREKR